MVESQLLLQGVIVGDKQLDQLVACFKALSPNGRQKLLAEAEKLERRERTAMILQHAAKQKRGNRRDDVEMGFDDFARFVQGLPVDQTYAVRIWSALARRAARAGKMQGIKLSDRSSEVKKLRFTVGFIREIVQLGAVVLDSVGDEIFEILAGWEKTL